MEDAQTKLAAEIAEILKDTTLSSEDRLIKMRSKLKDKILTPEESAPKEELSPNYNSQAIKKIAMRNQILKDQPEKSN